MDFRHPDLGCTNIGPRHAPVGSAAVILGVAEADAAALEPAPVELIISAASHRRGSTPDRPVTESAGTEVSGTMASVTARLTALLAALSILGGLAGVTAPSGRADIPGVITISGLDRTYLVHVPPGPPAGLVINLHGAGQNGAQQAGITGYNGVADGFGFVVAYPDGIDASWADGRGASIPDRTGVDDVGFLAALVDRLSRDYAVPPGRVFVTGMSAGGFMATRFACDRADLVSAVAPVAGTLGSGVPCNPSRPVSLMQIHGTADPVVPFGGGPMVGRGGASDIVSAPALVERWRGIDGCPGPLIADASSGAAQFLTAGGCAGNTAVVLVRLDGAGHTWPAGRFALPANIVGSTSDAVDASQATAQFFAAH